MHHNNMKCIKEKKTPTTTENYNPYRKMYPINV